MRKGLMVKHIPFLIILFLVNFVYRHETLLVADSTPIQLKTTPIVIEGTIESIDWHPNGEILALSGNRGVWLVSDNNIENVNLDSARRIRWSSSGSMLAVARWNGDIDVYETETWQKLSTLDTFDAEIFRLPHLIEWSHDDIYLAVASIAPSTLIEIWDVESTQRLYQIPTPDDDGVLSFDWSPTNYDLVVGYVNAPVTIYRLLRTEAIPQAFYTEQPFSAGAVMWNPVQDIIAVAGLRIGCADVWDLDEDSVFIWNLDTNETDAIFRTNQCGYFHPMTWNLDGNLIAFTSQNPVSEQGQTLFLDEIRVINIQTGDTAYTQVVDRGEEVITEMYWQPNGNRIAYRLDSVPFMPVIDPNDPNLCRLQVVGIWDLETDSNYFIEAGQEVCRQ